MTSRAVLGLTILLVGLTGERADAGFRVCNQVEQRLSIAFGYVDRARGWVAQGWWVVNAGQCTSIYNADLDNRYYYVFAEPTGGGPPWKGGKVPFCIQDKAFLLYQAEYGKDTPEDCTKAGLRPAQFIAVDVGPGVKNHTINFSGNETAQPPAATAPPPSQPSAAVPPRPVPPAAAPGGGGGTPCQRYPNLC